MFFGTATVKQNKAKNGKILIPTIAKNIFHLSSAPSTKQQIVKDWRKYLRVNRNQINHWAHMIYNNYYFGTDNNNGLFTQFSPTLHRQKATHARLNSFGFDVWFCFCFTHTFHATKNYSNTHTHKHTRSTTTCQHYCKENNKTRMKSTWNKLYSHSVYARNKHLNIAAIVVIVLRLILFSITS